MIDNWIESVGHERLCWTSHHNAMSASLGIAEGGLKSGNQFSGNRAKGPAIVSVQSVCPEITDKAFVTHCAQLLSSWRSKVLLHLCLVVVETCRGQCGLSQSMEIWGVFVEIWVLYWYVWSGGSMFLPPFIQWSWLLYIQKKQPKPQRTALWSDVLQVHKKA